MKPAITFFITFFLLVGTVVAQDKDKTNNKDYVQLSEPVTQTEAYRVFGSSFNDEVPGVSLEDLVKDSEQFNGRVVTTEGKIKQVCQKKGCFFMLETGKDMVRISFKDYSFFIPTNTAGSHVKLNGTFDVKTISEKEAKHFAEDAGNDPDAITGPQKEYALVATSVVIYK